MQVNSGGSMCGIFGGISEANISNLEINVLSKCSERRGKDSSGLVWKELDRGYKLIRADKPLRKILNEIPRNNLKLIAGHSRLITNGFSDNQPVVHNQIIALHNGIILNEKEIWNYLKSNPRLGIDSEVLPYLVNNFLEKGISPNLIPELLLEKCKGSISAAIIMPRLGKMLLFSNTGSLYLGEKQEGIFFASEKHTLELIHCTDVKQVKNSIMLDIPGSESKIEELDINVERLNLIPTMVRIKHEEDLLHFDEVQLVRCSKCVLPETMPYIDFDSFGVCNYCRNYKINNQSKNFVDFESLLSNSQELLSRKCIFPFSGGRDSSYGLHLAINELNLRPLTFTYDWGMVTDLARRNISNMCSKLGVENIIIAADISKKRINIRKNLIAWLSSPNLGMLSMLTAGDKHFFKYAEVLSRENNIALNLWSINPLEVTHFKAGFLGIKPDFSMNKVYRSGLSKQFAYQSQRFKSMLKSPRYFNLSLYDTLSGEYYRSKSKDKSYVHLFDYFKWDESMVEKTLSEYSWEHASDSTSSWRIGDGTAAFYNYVYQRVAGFTEHDTFRSNQIREGDITRNQALALIAAENLPRYQNIKWYLDTLNLDFTEVISVINSIPRMQSFMHMN